MSYSVKALEGAPILLAVTHQDYSTMAEGPQLVDRILSLLNDQPPGVVLVLDLRAASFTLEDVIMGTAMVTRRVQLLKHSKVAGTVVVTQNRFLKLTAEALKHPAFGGIELRVIDSLDLALSYARSAAGRR